MPKALAGKFKPHVPAGYQQHQRRILYIGKATAGDFDEEDASARFFNGKSAFWNFARSISTRADPTCSDLSNIAWSNIFKQGVQAGNPAGSIAREQWTSASAELRKEALTLEPSVIVLANAGYYEDLPREAFDIPQTATGGQDLVRVAVNGEPKFDLWYRSAYGTFPPLVWMYHPQRKHTEYTAAAVNLIASVAGW